MAQHKSAKKRARQALKRRARNRGIRTAVRTRVKAFRAVSEAAEDTTASLRSAEGLIRRSASKGVIPKKRASRQVSRLAKQANRTAAN
ncbi:MAG: 30S ribosomal protein S20 [Deltaproteobacteria bacterium]|nr:30S ribosomal protein S20 [Deltaproteobacteria bacterium]MBW2400697.1 30S ribosomal protein S20 [Deltaproteobacteria bacterium]MBW2666918.1 30S ribosomal protein S20 [Deltaproteobacteria bacterium]